MGSIKKTPEDFKKMYSAIKSELSKVVKGQEEAIKFVIIALLTNGHILLEGLPGLGKTLIANTLSKILGVDFKRIQFTPDLMPSDIVGTTIFNYGKNDFVVRKGPVFTNFLLADEINRSPAKTQAALLEVMQERHVTIDGTTYPLDEPFITIATQNPIEFEGTYPLPEAQLDRFMFKILINYATLEEEKEMLYMFRDGFDSQQLEKAGVKKIISHKEFISYKDSLDSVTVDDKIIDYITRLVNTTRKTPGIEVGASPRASIFLLKAARALAAVDGRIFVVPDDVKEASFSVLRHRLILDSEAEIAGKTPDNFIESIIKKVEIPR